MSTDDEIFRPFHTDIAYFECRAAGLLSAFESRLPAVCQQIRRVWPQASGQSDDELLESPFTLSEARDVTAHEHGFGSWSAFEKHITALSEGNETEPFLDAFRALEASDYKAIDAILNREPSLVNAQGTNGNTLLNLAVAVNSEPAVLLLLERGADPNIGNVRGWTPLHQAAGSNLVSMIEKLIESGAKPDAEALGSGGTPLVIALFWAREQAVKALSQFPLTPRNLRTAAGVGDIDMVRGMFDDWGALRPEAGIDRGFYRPHSGFPVWHPSNDPQEIVDEALTYAARNGKLEIVSDLFDRGANLNRDVYRGSALHWTAWKGERLDMAEWLVDHGANVNLKATFGGPSHGGDIAPIHLAAQRGKLPMVKKLIELGADYHQRDGIYNGDAIGHAHEFGRVEIVDYLRALEQ